MDRLWSPWRFAYVTGQPTEGCAFCVVQEVEDGEDNLIVRREPHAYLILNRYPYNSGHCMVVPARHVDRLSDLDADETTAVWDLTARVSDLLRDSMNAQGVNVGVNLGRASGGSIDHLHVHVVPRWHGDTNFMPIVGGAKVLVEMLSDTYARFQEALADWA